MTMLFGAVSVKMKAVMGLRGRCRVTYYQGHGAALNNGAVQP